MSVSCPDQRGIRPAENPSEDLYNAEHGFPDALSKSIALYLSCIMCRFPLQVLCASHAALDTTQTPGIQIEQQPSSAICAVSHLPIPS